MSNNYTPYAQAKPLLEKALIDSLNLPEKLVRFYGNIDYALDVIENNQLTLIRVDQFNDPFEFEFNHWGTISNNTRKTHFVASFSAIQMHTNKKDTLYMWAHYANGHRGVAIKFSPKSFLKDIEAISRYVNKIHFINNSEIDIPINSEIRTLPIEKLANDIREKNHSNFKPRLKEALEEFDTESKKLVPDGKIPWPVNYQEYPFTKDEYIKFVEDTPNFFTDSNVEILTRKDIFWKNEQEWRIIKQNDKTSLPFIKQPLPQNAISAVYLGLKTSEKDEERIKKQLTIYNQNNTEKAKLFKAIKVEGEYKVKFKAINL
jgi:hypothetical protein